MLSGQSPLAESKATIYDSFTQFYKKPVQHYVNDYLREAQLSKPSPEPYCRLLQRLEYLTAADKTFILAIIDSHQRKSIVRWSEQVKTLSSKHYLLLGLFHNAFLQTKKAYDFFKLTLLVAKNEKSAISELNTQFAGCILNSLGHDKFLIPSHPGSLNCFAEGAKFSVLAVDSLKMPGYSAENAQQLRRLAIISYQNGARHGCIKSLLQLGKEYWYDDEKDNALRCFDTIIAFGSFPDACLTVLELLREDSVAGEQLFLKRKKYFDLALAQGALQQYPDRFSQELAINCRLISADDISVVISYSILYRELLRHHADCYTPMLNFHLSKAQANPIALAHCIMGIVENKPANSEIFKSTTFKILLHKFNEFVQVDPDLFFKMHLKEGRRAGMRDYELAIEKQLLTPITLKIMKNHLLAVLREVDVLVENVDRLVTQYMLPS